jgi:hypothetical protein
MDSARATSLSRCRPSGVSSYTQATTSAGTKPSASRITTLRTAQSGAPNTGSRVPATCVSSHAPTR